MSFGVTIDGFNLKTLNDIKAESLTSLGQISDPVSGEFLQPDFTQADPAMQIIEVDLGNTADGWQNLQTTYDQFNPQNATGPTLSALVQLNGITRGKGSPSTVLLALVGTIGVTINASEANPQQVSDVNKINVWNITNDFTFSGAGTVSVTASSDEVGAITANIGTLTRIITPDPDWDSTNNPTVANVGEPVESDTELRRRRDISTLAPSQGLPSSIQANVANVDNVTFARIYINNTLATDGDGIPAKVVAPVILGGTDQDVAEVLFIRSDASKFFGTSGVIITDKQGFSNDVRFTRPTPDDIFIAIDLSIVNSDIYPSNGADQIKNNIILYAAGGAPALGIDDGFDEQGFVPGADILLSRLFTPINSVPGHTINSVFIDFTASPTGTDDLTIPYNHIGNFLAANIDITVS